MTPSPSVESFREKVARIIRPQAWEKNASGLWRFRDALKCQAEALAKADAVLALLPSPEWKSMESGSAQSQPCGLGPADLEAGLDAEPAAAGMPLTDKLRDAKNWLNGGECCGQVDSAGVCFAPACIFGEACKWMFEAADEIDRQAEMGHTALAALDELADDGRLDGGVRNFAMARADAARSASAGPSPLDAARHSSGAEAEPSGAWRPIETAPRDETRILLICSSAYSPEARMGWWREDGWVCLSPPDHKLSGGIHVWFPTHWQPLPPPPEASPIPSLGGGKT